MCKGIEVWGKFLIRPLAKVIILTFSFASLREAKKFMQEVYSSYTQFQQLTFVRKS